MFGVSWEPSEAVLELPNEPRSPDPPPLSLMPYAFMSSHRALMTDELVRGTPPSKFQIDRIRLPGEGLGAWGLGLGLGEGGVSHTPMIPKAQGPKGEGPRGRRICAILLLVFPHVGPVLRANYCTNLPSACRVRFGAR